MKSLALTLLASMITLNASATAQSPDRIIYKGAEYRLHTNPMGPYFDKHPDKHPNERPGPRAMSTALWRGYVASFIVTNGMLQLNDIEVLPVKKDDDSLPYKMQSVMKGLCPEGKPLVADWFSGILVLPYGDRINYVHMGYRSTYANYILIEVNEGKVGKEKRLDAEQYAEFKDKQFDAFKKTGKYIILNRKMEKGGRSQEDIDSLLRSDIGKYTSRFLDEAAQSSDKIRNQPDADSSETNNTNLVDAPFVSDFDILGFKLGEYLDETAKKADLLLSRDLNRYQFYTPPQPPQNSIKEVTLGYAKMYKKSSRLSLITIVYDEEQIGRSELLKNVPTGGKVLENGVNEVGNYGHITSHLMIADGMRADTVLVEIRLVERADGKLWMEYSIKDVFEVF